jgi:hypothetical protein
VDLSWLSIVSSIISIAGILTGALWVTEPIKFMTDGLIAKLTFMPLFFYRMLAWLIIVSFLHSFSLVVLAGLAIFNILVLCFLQRKKHVVEPVVQSIMSLAFPITR